MPVGARLLLFWIGSAAVIAVVLFIWGRRSGQFRDIEEAKYRMLEDREPAPWPGRENGEKKPGCLEVSDARATGDSGPGDAGAAVDKGRAAGAGAAEGPKTPDTAATGVDRGKEQGR
jgi:cbb3-type cytochrome oxidase maturation protein